MHRTSLRTLGEVPRGAFFSHQQLNNTQWVPTTAHGLFKSSMNSYHELEGTVNKVPLPQHPFGHFDNNGRPVIGDASHYLLIELISKGLLRQSFPIRRLTDCRELCDTDIIIHCGILYGGPQRKPWNQSILSTEFSQLLVLVGVYVCMSEGVAHQENIQGRGNA